MIDWRDQIVFWSLAIIFWIMMLGILISIALIMDQYLSMFRITLLVKIIIAGMMGYLVLPCAALSSATIDILKRDSNINNK